MLRRLVLIDKSSKTYKVYKNKVCLATYIAETKGTVPTLEQIEEIRVANYPTKA